VQFSAPPLNTFCTFCLCPVGEQSVLSFCGAIPPPRRRARRRAFASQYAILVCIAGEYCRSSPCASLLHFPLDLRVKTASASLGLLCCVRRLRVTLVCPHSVPVFLRPMLIGLRCVGSAVCLFSSLRPITPPSPRASGIRRLVQSTAEMQGTPRRKRAAPATPKTPSRSGHRIRAAAAAAALAAAETATSPQPSYPSSPPSLPASRGRRAPPRKGRTAPPQTTASPLGGGDGSRAAASLGEGTGEMRCMAADGGQAIAPTETGAAATGRVGAGGTTTHQAEAAQMPRGADGRLTVAVVGGAAGAPISSSEMGAAPPPPATQSNQVFAPTLESVGKSNVGRWRGSGTHFMPRYSWYPHLEPICGYRGHLTHAKYRSMQAAVATPVAPAAPPALVPADLGASTHKFREARRRSTFRGALCRRQPPPWLPQRCPPPPPRQCLPMPLRPTPSMLAQLPRLCCPPPGLP